MELGAWLSEITQIGQSTNGGFTIVSVIALIATWLLYRGARAQFVTLQAELDACNRKHERSDLEMDGLRRQLQNLSTSAAALWTLINMSGDRRGYQLPPLNEVLEGRLVIQVRAGQPEDQGSRRGGSPPLVAFDDPASSG